jgi:hypothetical protein
MMQSIKKLFKFPRILYFFIPIIVISLFFIDIPAPAVPITGIEFLGYTTLPNNLSFEKTPVGGLSGITYDSKRKLYYTISDDRSEKAPARFYTLKIDLRNESLKNGGVVSVDVTTLLNEKGQPFPSGSVDPEGIALTERDTVFVSSEGDVRKKNNPFIKEFDLSSGKELTTLPIPDKFLTNKRERGIRNNLAFESLAIAPNNQYLFAATENALFQDGSEAKLGTSSPCRILQYNLQTQKLEKEFLYLTEAIKPLLAPRFDSGLTDLVALDNQGNFVSIERTFTGLGFSISLFQVSLQGADDIHNIDSLLAVDAKDIKPVEKKLLLDLRTLDVALDNIEGLTLGPKLSNGQRSLILVSDNNFNTIQQTQILAFRLKLEPAFIRWLRRLFHF